MVSEKDGAIPDELLVEMSVTNQVMILAERHNGSSFETVQADALRIWEKADPELSTDKAMRRFDHAFGKIVRQQRILHDKVSGKVYLPSKMPGSAQSLNGSNQEPPKSKSTEPAKNDKPESKPVQPKPNGKDTTTNNASKSAQAEAPKLSLGKELSTAEVSAGVIDAQASAQEQKPNLLKTVNDLLAAIPEEWRDCPIYFRSESTVKMKSATTVSLVTKNNDQRYVVIGAGDIFF